METLIFRFLKASDDLMERSTDGMLVFNQRFEQSMLEKYAHYLNKHNHSILQIEQEFPIIGMVYPPFKKVDVKPFTPDELFSIIKNLVQQGTHFNIFLDADEEEAEYFKELGVLQVGKSTKEEYLSLIEEYKEDFLHFVYSIKVRNEVNEYHIDIVTNGWFRYTDFKQYDNNTEFTSLTTIDATQMVVKMIGYEGLLQDFEGIRMSEKDIVPSPYSKLYVLMDYIEAHRDTLPHQVAEALGYADLEANLKQLGENNKNKSQYKN